MYSNFLKLGQKKQKLIINAAFKEFGEKGYGQASTNEIIKTANISKGILFHYFKSKKQLFLFLYDYAVDRLIIDFYEKIDFKEKDLFKRVEQAIQIKMTLMSFPDLFLFFEKAYLEQHPAIHEELEHRREQLTEINFQRLFDGIDKTLFRQDIDIDQAIRIIMLSLEGLSQDIVRRSVMSGAEKIDYDAAYKETRGYLMLLRTVFYK